MNVQNSTCFSQENVLAMKQMMHSVTYKTGSFLYQEGDPADRLYYIHSGKVKISKHTEDGKEYTMYLFQDGDFLGQLDPYSHSKQSFAARTLENCEVGYMHKEELAELLWKHHGLAMEFLQWLSLLHRMTQTKLRDLLMYGKLGALCSTLIRLSNSYGTQSDEGIHISLKVTNSDLAHYIGCARESVNRMLSDLKKKKAIAINDGYITITNLPYLQETCHCEMCPVEICRI